MSDFDQQWGSAQVGGGDEQSNFDPPLDGDHDIELARASAFTSKKGEDWVALDLRKLQDGYKWTVMLGFRSQGQANLTKTACSRLGVQVDEVISLEQLSAELERRVGDFYSVTVKTNGEYRNTYIDGPMQMTDVPIPSAEMAAAAAPTGVDDDIPF